MKSHKIFYNSVDSKRAQCFGMYEYFGTIRYQCTNCNTPFTGMGLSIKNSPSLTARISNKHSQKYNNLVKTIYPLI